MEKTKEELYDKIVETWKEFNEPEFIGNEEFYDASWYQRFVIEIEPFIHSTIK